MDFPTNTFYTEESQQIFAARPQTSPAMDDIQKSFEIVMTKLVPNKENRSNYGVLCMMKALYMAKPKAFHLGPIHTSADGDRSYYSGKMWVSNNYFYNFHVYVILRSSKIIVKNIELYMNEEKFLYEFQKTILPTTVQSIY